MGILIDTQALVSVERDGRTLGDFLAGQGDEEFAGVAAITMSELYFGLHRADSSRRATARSAFIEAVVATLTVLPFDLDAARTHARVWAALASTGTMIGAHDLLIAATALTHDLTVITASVREFQRVPDLRVLPPMY